MAYQRVFRRYESKYLLTQAQKERLLCVMQPYMQPDCYGRTVIRNLYLDTADYRLIRRSIEKPLYKEKLRIRSYVQATPQTQVFAELKKKYDHVVYKRRVCLPYEDATAWLCAGDLARGGQSQIAQEINYATSYYGALRPTVFLCYEREAYAERNGGDFRVTFDENIRFRQTNLSLISPADGIALLDEDTVLMELKCSGGIPLWMTAALSRERLYRTSFSKYGTAYQCIKKGSTEYDKCVQWVV